MKVSKITVLLIFLFCFTLIASETIFSSFTANSSSNSIILEWRTTDETGIAKFEIERSVKGAPFQKIAEERAKGVPSFYRYIDSEALMKAPLENDKNDATTLNKNYYTYRIKTIFSNGSTSYSDEVKVNHTINSIRRTWGMIKEMFK